MFSKEFFVSSFQRCRKRRNAGGGGKYCQSVDSEQSEESFMDQAFQIGFNAQTHSENMTKSYRSALVSFLIIETVSEGLCNSKHAFKSSQEKFCTSHKK